MEVKVVEMVMVVAMVMVIMVVATDAGGADNSGGDDRDHVNNSHSPRSQLQQQMLVHRFFVPSEYVSNRVSGW